MKRTVLLAVALLLVAGVAHAGEINTVGGTKALIFGFSGLSNLGLSGHQGTYGIGARYYFQEQLAIVPGIQFGLSATTTKAQADDYSDEKTGSATFGLSCAIEKHITGPKSVSPYVGVGACFSSSATATEPSIPDNAPQNTLERTTVGEFSFGGFLMAGFQWSFAGPMTLGGEYRANLGFSSGSTEREYVDAPKQKSNETSGFNIGFSTASIFLSVEI